MSLPVQQNKWYFVLTLVYGIAVLVDWLFVPERYGWQWVNFGLSQLRLAALFGLVALWASRRWVFARLVIVWAALAVIGLSQTL
ncbi:hypothetical protein [Deinococcus sp. ME38]|uniref:hypothetical protein n=1 Tax=Deinococcus sp. ME38 TaxID=3400344 RepID=UPI003B595012